MTRRTLLTYLLVGSASLATGFALYWLIERTWIAHGQTTLQAPSKSDLIAGDTLGARRPDFVLPDLDGRNQSVNQWDGKVVLVNFWATWCPPCRREIPEFVDVREKYVARGFEVVGIAIEENHDAVREFAEETGVNYPLLIGAEPGVEIARSYGNRLGALPYSVLFDREGTIRFVRPGELSGETLEIELKKLL
ncbi:MAG: redoxin domain-containing protein [Gammaproteobacteria bacterium]